MADIFCYSGTRTSKGDILNLGATWPWASQSSPLYLGGPICNAKMWYPPHWGALRAAASHAH